MKIRALVVTSLAVLAAFSGCSSDEDPTSESPAVPSSAKAPGALIRTSMESTVGVLLDTLPASMRDRAAKDLEARPEDFWRAQARSQILLTKYRLAYRGGYYADVTPPKAQLPLPPDAVWRVTLKGKPVRRQVDGHDVVAVDYAYNATIVSREDSPAVAEPALAEVGGVWEEPFSFPVDPRHVMQRTGLACIDEAGFPANSIDPEEVAIFYDQDCQVETELTPTGVLVGAGCHGSGLPAETCRDALTARIGRIDTKVRFERVAWSEAEAKEYRFGDVETKTGAQLRVGAESEIFPHPKAVYRYIPSDSCTIAEKCVGGAGWRRLIQFSSVAWNLGVDALTIGAVETDESGKLLGELAKHNVYEFSGCHQHYHFMHYGEFSFGDVVSPVGKRGFCLQSTDRLSNNESTPLHNPFGTCAFQGIEAGWGDNYNSGIECQWVDATDEDTSKGPVTKNLRESLNPDAFLCEGKAKVDASGAVQYEPTEFKTADGAPVDRPLCEFTPNYLTDNVHSDEFTLKAHGNTYVNEACTRGQVGPERNCGFSKQADGLTCTPGSKVTLSCSIAGGSAPQAIRVCEASRALGVGIACSYGAPGIAGGVGPENAALGVGIAEDGATATITFDCPGKRDEVEVGGVYAIFAGTMIDGDAPAAVTCKVQ